MPAGMIDDLVVAQRDLFQSAARMLDDVERIALLRLAQRADELHPWITTDRLAFSETSVTATIVKSSVLSVTKKVSGSQRNACTGRQVARHVLLIVELRLGSERVVEGAQHVIVGHEQARAEQHAAAGAEPMRMRQMARATAIASSR